MIAAIEKLYDSSQFVDENRTRLSNNEVIYKKADNPRMIVFIGINLWLSNTLAVHPSDIFTTFSALIRKLCFGAVRDK